MNKFRILLTFLDGTVKEVQITAEIKAFAISKALDAVNSAEIASVDFMDKDDTPEVVAARKSKRRQSRADRFSEAQGKVSDGKAIMEELRDELQNWRDNLPENLQSSQKADDLDTAIGELEDAINDADNIEGKDVQFPGMFG